jgi:hypothetical protein
MSLVRRAQARTRRFQGFRGRLFWGFRAQLENAADASVDANDATCFQGSGCEQATWRNSSGVKNFGNLSRFFGT